MDNTTLSDAATGIFRLRSDDPHMANSTIVDLNDDAYTTLTTVEVRSGAVVLHCFTSLEAAELADEEEEEGRGAKRNRRRKKTPTMKPRTRTTTRMKTTTSRRRPTPSPAATA